MALTTSDLRAQDTLVVNLSLRTSNFSYGTQDGYDIIVPKRDRMDRITIPGHPQLPTWNPAHIIPVPARTNLNNEPGPYVSRG